jgi:uncharacterized membrane protein
MILLIHILAGGVGLVAGYVALYAAKGAALHRASGIVFVAAMAVMGVTAAVISAVQGNEATLLGGLLAVYLVATALTAVRSATPGSRRVDAGLAVLGLALSAGFFIVASRAFAGGGTTDGVPAPPLLVNAVVALLAGASDLRRIRTGPRGSAPRLARHLWRMCFALFLAAGSFFLGQADELPGAIRIVPLLAIPVLVPLAAIVYWMPRLRRGPGAAGRRGVIIPTADTGPIPAGSPRDPLTAPAAGRRP